jgi:uncharacterized protein (TIGR02646 family)
MRTIHKIIEPTSLTQHRNSAHADYANYAHKDVLRAFLLKEQRGLCCYCLSRISADGQKMKIAHWHSQTKHPGEQLDYANLLAACKGNEGQPRKQQHCDTMQGDRDLSRNPANPTHHVEDLIRFEGDGRVTSTDQEFDAEINDILNLNLQKLVNQRKARLDGFTAALPKHSQLKRDDLQRWLEKWNGEADLDELEPFCSVVVYWLRKRLNRS